MATFVSPSVKYYRINANNTTLAQSFDGTNNGGSPTEEITAPLFGGTLATYTPGTPSTITGNVGAQFSTLFQANQYLYFLDNGVYKLIGQIAATPPSATSLTITSTAVNVPPTNASLYAAFALITGNESIYMRIETVGPPTAPPNTRWIPNLGLGFWRVQQNITGVNNTAQSQLQRVSDVGTPLSNAQTGAENIPFTFVSMNLFRIASQQGGFAGTTYFPTTNDFPLFIWIRVTPQIGSTTALSGQTLYRFTTQESMEALPVIQGTTAGTLSGAGYSNVSTSPSSQNNGAESA
jgi:hypothetical protein